MNKWSLAAGCWGLMSLFIACGNDRPPPEDGPNLPTGKAGKTGQGGSDGHAGEEAGGTSPGGAASTDDLDIEITFPTAASDPVVDDIIVGGEVTAICVVKAGSSGEVPDASTVMVELLDANGMPALGADNKPLAAPGVPTGEPDEYSAMLGIAAIATGKVGVRCSANSIDKSVMSSDTITTFVDHGPAIVEKLPEEDSAHPIEQILAVEFTVTPVELVAGDDEAAVAGVVLYVGGKEIPATEDPQNLGTYRASVNFQDETVFEEPPTEHTSVRIEAINTRSPNPATGVRDYPFVVDGSGPSIAFLKPKDNAPIKGETVVEFTASDTGSGIDVDTLLVTLTGRPTPIKFDADDTSVWGRKANTFTFRFDTGVLVGIESQVSLRVDVDDIAGNHANGESIFLYLDDKAPLIDLDPDNARSIGATDDVCSASFDPLGQALGDGAVTSVRNNLFRALIYDQTNHGSGQNVFYMAGTDETSARLYIQIDPTQPFLVDSDEDGVCDALAREDFPYQTLSPVRKQGTPKYATDYASPPAIPSPPAAGVCTLKPPLSPPDNLCSDSSDMWVVIQHDVDTKADEPVVYAMGALAGFECTGSKWDIASELATDGWVCLAASASDNLGNVGVSAPLRVCFDDPHPSSPGSPPCALASEPPPSCTTNCVAPPGFPSHIFRAP